jgi:hypothetical protein
LKCYPSRPPGLEERQINRLHAEAVKKRKNAAEATAERKRKRKERHDKACKIARAEGKPRPATPESMDDEEEASDAEVHPPGDDEAAAAAGASSPPVYQGDGDEAPATAERRLPTLAAGRGSPSPAVGGESSAPAIERRSPQPATGEGVSAPMMSTCGDGSAASAEAFVQIALRPQPALRVTPSDQASRGVGVPRARRSGTGKRSMSAR